MMIYYLIIILSLNEIYKVLTLNIELSNQEKNLLYTHIQTQNDLNLFYQKILQSNDRKNLNLENKVNIKEIFCALMI